MINLLLPEDQKRIFKEYRSRVAVSYGLVLIILLVISIIVISIFYFSLSIDRESIDKILLIENNGAEVKEFDNYTSQIVVANKMLNLLTGDKGNLHLPSILIDRVILSKPSGIKLKTIEIGRNEKKQWVLNLRGSSRTRNDIVNFIATLKKDPLFPTIDSPFSNLIKEGGSEFGISIILASQLDQKNEER